MTRSAGRWPAVTPAASRRPCVNHKARLQRGHGQTLPFGNPNLRYSLPMRFALVLSFVVAAAAAAESRAPGGIFLAGEPLRVASDGSLRFTDRQIRGSATSTRAGLARWMATADGRRLFDYFTSWEYEVVVTEDASEAGMGRAPQPGIATMVSAGDRTRRKIYELIINPSPRSIPDGLSAFPGQATTPADLIAAAWAGEMLHVYFYSLGVLLPHHGRRDFQEQWTSVAAQLGFPAMEHGQSEPEEGSWRRSRRSRGTW
jgi:hypothetical protein